MKGFMFIVTLVLGVLSHNAAFSDNMPMNTGNQGMMMNDGNYRNDNFRNDNFRNDNFQGMRNINEVPQSNDGYYAEGDVSPNCEYRSGPCTCYCPVTTFKPCYYTEKRCVQEPYCEYKRCCRYVPQYCQKQCCRYVPQYYCKTYCKQVPEYYCVPVQKCRTRTICERKCRYVPCTYMKKTTIDCPPADSSCCAPADCAPSGCASGMCPR